VSAQVFASSVTWISNVDESPLTPEGTARIGAQV
jgi:hypothetical protein